MTLTTASNRTGRYTSAARTIIEPPRDHRTSNINGPENRPEEHRKPHHDDFQKHQPEPRISRKRDKSDVDRPARSRHSHAETPASKANPGAQKMCDPSRKEQRRHVRVMSSGGNTMAAEWKKSRVWSSAMIMMIRPRDGVHGLNSRDREGTALVGTIWGARANILPFSIQSSAYDQ